METRMDRKKLIDWALFFYSKKSHVFLSFCARVIYQPEGGWLVLDQRVAVSKAGEATDASN
jgi:hypothetical protein